MYQQIVKLYPSTATFYTNNTEPLSVGLWPGINIICVTQPNTFLGKHKTKCGAGAGAGQERVALL